MHSSNAAGGKYRVAAFALSELQILDSVVSQHSIADVGLSAREMPELWTEDFGALFFGGAANGAVVPGVLAELREAIPVDRACICDFFGGTGGGDVY